MTNIINFNFFAGHESFYLREGWLKKSLDVVEIYPEIFQSRNLKEAINQLGVGANMVKSMRYWLDLCGLIQKTKNGNYLLTNLSLLLRKFDPFIQHHSSLWMIHSIVADNSPIWKLIFTEHDLPVFERNSIQERMEPRLKEEGRSFAQKTIKDSISVFINTYLSDKTASDPESNIISPFSKLKLMTHFDHKYAFRTITFAEYSPFFIFFLLPSGTKKQVSQNEIYKKMKTMMNIELNGLRKSLDYLENTKLIHIDRAGGLNNILKQEHLSLAEIF